MNCFDCADFGITSEAVAVCADCGAGLCVDHARVAPRWLTRTTLTCTVAVEPAARTIYCGTCHAARVARGDLGTVARPTSRR